MQHRYVFYLWFHDYSSHTNSILPYLSAHLQHRGVVRALTFTCVFCRHFLFTEILKFVINKRKCESINWNIEPLESCIFMECFFQFRHTWIPNGISHSTILTISACLHVFMYVENKIIFLYFWMNIYGNSIFHWLL